MLTHTHSHNVNEVRFWKEEWDRKGDTRYCIRLKRRSEDNLDLEWWYTYTHTHNANILNCLEYVNYECSFAQIKEEEEEVMFVRIYLMATEKRREIQLRMKKKWKKSGRKSNCPIHCSLSYCKSGRWLFFYNAIELPFVCVRMEERCAAQFDGHQLVRRCRNNPTVTKFIFYKHQ